MAAGVGGTTHLRGISACLSRDAHRMYCPPLPRQPGSTEGRPVTTLHRDGHLKGGTLEHTGRDKGTSRCFMSPCSQLEQIEGVIQCSNIMVQRWKDELHGQSMPQEAGCPGDSPCSATGQGGSRRTLSNRQWCLSRVRSDLTIRTLWVHSTQLTLTLSAAVSWGYKQFHPHAGTKELCFLSPASAY